MKIIPEEFQLNKLSLRDLNLRRKFVTNYTWAIPSWRAIHEIVQFAGNDLITEVGAGRGYWAMLIAHYKGRIRCFDLKKGPNRYFGNDEDWDRPVDENFKTFYKVRFFDSQIELEYAIAGSNLLMFCWPEWDLPWAFEYLNDIFPDKVIYIGEWKGGCCADNQFFEYLDENYEVQKIIQIPRWSGIKDDLRLFKRTN